MPTIKVPEITIPKVDVPKTPFINEHVLTGIIPGCNLFHRDLEITKNPSILFNDRKAFVTCPEGEMPSFEPVITKGTATGSDQSFRSITYDPQESIETEGTYEYKGKAFSNNFNFQSKNEEDTEIEEVPCPPKDAPFRPGDWRNELRLERLVKYERGLLEGSCDAIWEEVPFVDQYIPTASVVVSTAVIASVAATTPLLLNIVKPLVKNIIKKLTKKKNDVK